jgi:uncharacterized membrane protein
MRRACSASRPDEARGRWLAFALVTTAFWGVWGALIELPEKAGFPATLGYSVWALTMIPCAAIALRVSGTRISAGARAMQLGALVGVLGAGGQLVLFEALRTGPAYLVFPIVSLYPVLTILLSLALLHERATRRQWIGIGLALPAMRSRRSSRSCCRWRSTGALRSRRRRPAWCSPWAPCTAWRSK